MACQVTATASPTFAVTITRCSLAEPTVTDSDYRNDNNDVPVARENLGILQIDQKEQISEKKKKGR